eukprot:TRINITY_DN9377_c0_g1_i1.p1 TRINITY_DN9377_c0_g1~~TRINITY_DN9377_c0_g1_i1.p1  ORF type:complete len:556 (+),score=148.06 TRINITY_DN9377_c0_g1_i1:40-1668(+)
MSPLLGAHQGAGLGGLAGGVTSPLLQQTSQNLLQHLVASAAPQPGERPPLAAPEERAASSSGSRAPVLGKAEMAGAGTSSGSTAPPPKPCHLHRKPNKNCKTCQKVLEHAAQAAQAAERAAAEAAAASKRAGEDYKMATFNCSHMLKDQVLKASYFKSLLRITTVEALAEEIQNFCDSVDIYQEGSATSPSVFFCSVYRLFTMKMTDEELQMLLDYADSIYVRCVALLYVRIGFKPEKLWEMLEEYTLDDQELGAARKGGLPATVGEFTEELLLKEKYFGTPLPRLPIAVRRKLEERVSPLPQFRKRAQANRRILKSFRQVGTAVEFSSEGEWIAGKVLKQSNAVASRPRVNIQISEDQSEWVHLGKIILLEPAAEEPAPAPAKDAASDEEGADRKRRRSRSRSRRRGASPDLTRSRGKSDEMMLRELRERSKEDAVCASGKDYAKRLQRFETGLAIPREQGAEESKLIETETYNQPSERPRGRRGRDTEDHDENDAVSRRKREEEMERKQKLAQIYEKYGKQVSSARGSKEVDGPDVMRLG